MGVLVSDTVAGLGTPTEDGAKGLIRTAHVEEPLTWNKAQQVWIGEPAVSMRTNENAGISAGGSSTFWKYPGSQTEVPPPVVNTTAFGFRIHKVLYAGELWAAGLRLQELLSAEMKQIADVGVDDSSIALSWYPLDEGDSFLSPLAFNHGVRVVLDKDESSLNDIYRFCSSGWQNNTTIEADTPPTETQHFYPEIYLYGPVVTVRHFTALHRWVGGPGRGTSGSFEVASKYPPADDVRGWYRALSIGAVDNAAVKEWPDYSGRGQALRQSTSTKQPIIKVDGTTGIRYLQFDGVNDILRVNDSPIPTAGPEAGAQSPISLANIVTIYMVMRQRDAGGTTQVWFGPSGSGAPLIYRFDATDEVSAWFGGSDITYHRLEHWDAPMPWTIISVAADADDLTVWENLMPVASGATGGANITGWVIGNNDAENLPAALDIAELILCVGKHDDTERSVMINYLNDFYNIF